MAGWYDLKKELVRYGVLGTVCFAFDWKGSVDSFRQV